MAGQDILRDKGRQRCIENSAAKEPCTELFQIYQLLFSTALLHLKHAFFFTYT